MVRSFIKKVIACAITTTMIFSCSSSLTTIKANATTNISGTFGVGGGTYWPEQVFAPFVDMCLTSSKPGYNVNGTPYLPKLSEDTGIKYFNLGFIQSAGDIKDGVIQWGWGSEPSMSETGMHDQYYGIKKSIKDLREIGGDVTISFGGLNGVPFWQKTQDVDILANTYRELVNGYGLTRIDLDIEGSARDKTANIANAKAIKKVQDETGVEVVLTVPVLPDGLTPLEIGLMDAYLSEGVDIKLVNIMAMCYGSATLLPGENYGTGSIRAIDSTASQIKECYKQYASENISMEEAYRKVGVTTSVGFEGSAHPIFTTEWTSLVVNHAIEKGIGLTGFWSLNRDSMLQSNSGISAPYEHSKINMKFGTQVPNPNGNFLPKLYGVKDKIIGVNRTFDPMMGVSAIDPEDGDLTSKVKVEGTVNTSVVGVYTVKYSVTDSKGKSTTIERKVSVQSNVAENKKPELSGVSEKLVFLGGKVDLMEGVKAIDAEDGNLTNQIKVTGSVNTNKLGRYYVTYSVVDSDGAVVTATTIISVCKVPPYNAEVYNPNKTYKTQNEYVLFKGKIYQCKWWISGQDPDKSEAWKYVEDFDLGIEDNDDILSLSIAASLYNCKSTDTEYKIEYDTNKDGIIDIYDLSYIASNL